jgi:uncharacterized protein
MDRAHYFFNLNMENYPSSFSAFDAMGEFYARKGDGQKAIEYYKKSLSIRETADTRQKLEKLIKAQ